MAQTQDQTTQQDPKTQEPQPPVPEQPQNPPGSEAQMDPKPDYGEDTYRGSGRLEGKATIITGGDSGIGRAVGDEWLVVSDEWLVVSDE